MSWNYRVVRKTHNGEVQYGIHEAYDGGTGWTTDAVAPVGDDVEELRLVLDRMRTALDSPVIDEAPLSIWDASCPTHGPHPGTVDCVDCLYGGGSPS